MEPNRLAILQRLREPTSAAAISRETGLMRQKVNYHLRQLEKDGLAELVQERRKGNCVERLLRATARQYLVSPEAFGSLGDSPAGSRDRSSAAYLASTAALVIQDLARVRSRADAAGKRLATLTLEAEVKFASPEIRHAFAEELARGVANLIAKYHDDAGRPFRFWAGAYPKPPAGEAPQDLRPANME